MNLKYLNNFFFKYDIISLLVNLILVIVIYIFNNISYSKIYGKSKNKGIKSIFGFY